MKIINNLVVVTKILILLIPLTVHSGTESLSISKAKEMAIQNSNKLKQSHFETKESLHSLKKTKSGLLPQINLTSNFMRYLGPSKISGVPIKKNYSTEHSITVSQVLTTFGKLTHAINAGKIGYEVSKIKEAYTNNSLKVATEKLYYNAVLSQKLLEIHKESLKNAKTNKYIFQKRFANGRPPKSDILKLERDISSRVPKLNAAKNHFIQAHNNLKSVIGKTVELNLTEKLQKNISIPSLTTLEKNLIKNSFSLKIANKDLEFKDSMYKYAKADRYPKVGAFYSLTYSGEDNELDFSTKHSIKRVGAIGIQISIPLWDSGNRKSDIGQKFAHKKISEYQIKEINRNMDLRLKNLFSNFMSLRKEFKENQNFVRLAERTYKMSKKRFQSGQTSITELNDSELLLTQAKLQTASSLFNLHIVKLDIEELNGTEI